MYLYFVNYYSRNTELKYLLKLVIRCFQTFVTLQPIEIRITNQPIKSLVKSRKRARFLLIKWRDEIKIFPFFFPVKAKK